jgi:hypothetical protein
MHICLHTGGIHLSQDTESILCVHVVDVHDVFIQRILKLFHMYCFNFFNFGLGITFYYHFYF